MDIQSAGILVGRPYELWQLDSPRANTFPPGKHARCWGCPDVSALVQSCYERSTCTFGCHTGFVKRVSSFRSPNSDPKVAQGSQKVSKRYRKSAQNDLRRPDLQLTVPVANSEIAGTVEFEGHRREGPKKLEVGKSQTWSVLPMLDT